MRGFDSHPRLQTPRQEPPHRNALRGLPQFVVIETGTGQRGPELAFWGCECNGDIRADIRAVVQSVSLLPTIGDLSHLARIEMLSAVAGIRIRDGLVPSRHNAPS